MSDKAAEPQAPVEHLWVVKKRGELFAGYPRKVQAEVYASNFSGQEFVDIQMMTIHPIASAPSETGTPQDQRASAADTATGSEVADAGQRASDPRLGGATPVSASEQSEAHPIAPPARGTPRTDSKEAWVETPRTQAMIDGIGWNHGEMVSLTPVQKSRLEGMFGKVRELERELSAATERMNAPVPDVEGQVVHASRTADGGAFYAVPADLARDLGRRLSEARENLLVLRGYREQFLVACDQRNAAETARDEAVARERERCAKVCEAYADDLEGGANNTTGDDQCKQIGANECAAAIRGSSEGGGNG